MAYTNPSVTASGTTFAQFQAGGLSGQIEKLITAAAATLAPTVAHTWTATGGGSTGGSLAAGTYYSVVTESNGFGETTAGPESGQITVSATNIPRITFQSLKSGNTSRNVYIGGAGGSSGGPYALYATGITTSTYDLSAAAPATSYAVAPPTTNSTGLTYTITGSGGMVQNKTLELLRAGERGNLEDAYRFLAMVCTEFNRGQPVSFAGVIGKLRHAHAVFAMFATACAEIGTLIDANPGTIAPVSTPIGGSKMKRTWP
jgi:hypothetical protein